MRDSVQQPPKTLEDAVSLLVRQDDENIIWSMKSQKIVGLIILLYLYIVR